MINQHAILAACAQRRFPINLFTGLQKTPFEIRQHSCLSQIYPVLVYN